MKSISLSLQVGTVLYAYIACLINKHSNNDLISNEEYVAVCPNEGV